jgi:16S rRNA G966 N2-methylase RsmD
VVIVERDKRKRTTLLENTSIVETEIRVLFMPAERFVQQCSDQFFLIFLDPPFSYAYKLELIREIAEAGILTSGGILMIHYPKEEDLPQEIEGLTCYDLRRFGRSKLAFFTLSCPGE